MPKFATLIRGQALTQFHQEKPYTFERDQPTEVSDELAEVLEDLHDLVAVEGESEPEKRAKFHITTSEEEAADVADENHEAAQGTEESNALPPNVNRRAAPSAGRRPSPAPRPAVNTNNG